MTPNQVFAEARHVMNDTDAADYRQDDLELLAYLNAGINEACVLRPDLFISNAELTCDTGKTEQGLTVAVAKSLVEVIRIKNGRAVLPGDLAALQAFNPNWGQDAEGPAVNWFPYPGDPRRFYIYPKSPAGQILETKHVRNPTVIADSALDTEISELPSAFHTALVHYVVARCESKDDEHVLTQRASGHYGLFKENMMAGIPQQGA